MAERLDKLHLDGYSILQDKKKFCYGIDDVLLADFALKNTKSRIKDFETNKDFLFIDLGTGNGIIPILLAAKTGPRVKIQGIEIQEEIAEMACRSVKINSLEEEKYIVISKGSFLDGSYKHLLDDYIPKQRVKDIIDRIDYDIKKTKEIISKNTNIYASYRKNDYQIVRLRAMNTKSLDIKKRLQELLESEE